MRGELNPRERWSLLLIDEVTDRPPVYPLVTSHAATVAGCGVDHYCSDGKVLADAQLNAWRYYGSEGLSVFTDVGIIAEAMGSTYHYREFDVPVLRKPVIDCAAGWKFLSVPDPQHDGRLPVYLEAIQRLHSAKGDQVPVFAFIPCPFTTAAGLTGIDNFLVETLLNPGETHRLLDLALRAAERFCDECIIAGALPVLVDPLASGSVISRQVFSDFVLPYTAQLVRYLHRYDLDVTLHICGNTGNLIDLIGKTGTDLFSFDQVPLATVSEQTSGNIRLVGNIAPDALLSSSSADLAKISILTAREGMQNPTGFVLSTGCEVPVRCDRDRLKTMIKIGKAQHHHDW